MPRSRALLPALHPRRLRRRARLVRLAPSSTSHAASTTRRRGPGPHGNSPSRSRAIRSVSPTRPPALSPSRQPRHRNQKKPLRDRADQASVSHPLLLLPSSLRLLVHPYHARSYADIIAGRVRSWLVDAGSSSDAGSSNVTATAASRSQDLVGAQELLASTEHGRDGFRGNFDTKRPPAAWWM